MRQEERNQLRSIMPTLLLVLGAGGCVCEKESKRYQKFAEAYTLLMKWVSNGTEKRTYEEFLQFFNETFDVDEILSGDNDNP